MSADACNGHAEDSAPFQIGYLSDVEGNLNFFCNYVEQSTVLEFTEPPHEDSKMLHIVLRNDCYFVYGGDVVDKGPGDIRVCRALVALKQNYPNRVFLLVGNRDLNKLRFKAELSDNDMNRPISQIPRPHWDPTAPTFEEYLKGLVAKQGNFDDDEIKNRNTKVNRLKYLLTHTLGCPQTFEFRRKELAILNDVPADKVQDEEVVDSMLFEVDNPDGSLRQYLEAAQVAVRIGNTLFCHGAVDCKTMKFVPSPKSRFENPPSKPPPDSIQENLDAWIDALNDFLKMGVLDYVARPYWDESRSTRGGESLMALQNRPAMWGRSIVSNCYGDGGCITTKHAVAILNDPIRIAKEEYDPLVFEAVSSDPMDQEVADWLLENRIQRVVVGHKPVGDSPAVLSSNYTGVEIISADTSFSDTSAFDNRGKALPLVDILGSTKNDNHAEIRGILRDGTKYHSTFSRLYDGGVDMSIGDRILGTRIRDDWWVKATTCDGKYQLCRGEGRKVEYRFIDTATIEEFCGSMQATAL